jgi:hypothetical protein
MAHKLRVHLKHSLWTFSEHSLNIRWTFIEHSGNIQWTFSECSVNIQWAFSEHSANIQLTFSEHSVNIQWTFSELTFRDPNIKERETWTIPVVLFIFNVRGLFHFSFKCVFGILPLYFILSYPVVFPASSWMLASYFMLNRRVGAAHVVSSMLIMTAYMHIICFYML